MNAAYNLATIRSEIMAPEQLSKYLCMGLYGPPGCGKTVFCASGALINPKTGNPFIKNTLIIDFDKRGSKTVRFAPGVRVFKVNLWEDTDRILYWLVNTPNLGGFEGGVIALDTVSMGAAIAKDQAYGRARNNPGRITTKWEKTGWDEYYEGGDLTIELVNKFRLLADRANIIFTFHQQTKKISADTTKLQATLNPHAYDGVMPLLDVVGRMESATEVDDAQALDDEPEKESTELTVSIAKPKFTNYMFVQTSGQYDSKDRISGPWVPEKYRLPPIIKNPTFPFLLMKYRASLKAAAEASANPVMKSEVLEAAS